MFPAPQPQIMCVFPLLLLLLLLLSMGFLSFLPVHAACSIIGTVWLYNCPKRDCAGSFGRSVPLLFRLPFSGRLDAAVDPAASLPFCFLWSPDWLIFLYCIFGRDDAVPGILFGPYDCLWWSTVFPLGEGGLLLLYTPARFRPIITASSAKSTSSLQSRLDVFGNVEKIRVGRESMAA